MIPFTQTLACRSCHHCAACLAGQWHKLAACPHGITADNLPKPHLQSPISNLQSPLSPFSSLHRILVRALIWPPALRAWLRSGRCGCSARATRWDLALNRLLTPLYRSFKPMLKLRSIVLVLLLLLVFIPPPVAPAQSRQPITLISGTTTAYVDTVILDGTGITSLTASNYLTGRRIATLTLTSGTTGTTDHTVLSNLLWTASGHTGTPARLAGFFEGGAAGYAGFGAGLYLDGSDNITISNAVLAGADAGATAVQPAAIAGMLTNAANHANWTFYTDSATNYYALSRDSRTLLSSNDFAGLLQNVHDTYGRNGMRFHFVSVGLTPTNVAYFYFTNTVTVTKAIHLSGDGNPASVWKLSGFDGPMILATNISGIVTFSNLRLDGDSRTNAVLVKCVDVAEPVFNSYGELVNFGGIGLHLIATSMSMNWSFMQNWWLVPNIATARGIVIEGSGAERFQLLNGTHYGTPSGIVHVASTATNLQLQVMGNMAQPLGVTCLLVRDDGAKALTVVGNHLKNVSTGYGIQLDRASAESPVINIVGNTRTGTNTAPLVYVGANLSGANIHLFGNVVQAGQVATNWPYLGQGGGTISGNLTVNGTYTGNGSGLTGTGSAFTAGSALSYTGTNYFAYVNSSNYVWTTYADTLLSNLWLITTINGVNVNTNTLPNR
jgi:hypothetical protein